MSKDTQKSTTGPVQISFPADRGSGLTLLVIAHDPAHDMAGDRITKITENIVPGMSLHSILAAASKGNAPAQYETPFRLNGGGDDEEIPDLPEDDEERTHGEERSALSEHYGPAASEPDMPYIDIDDELESLE